MSTRSPNLYRGFALAAVSLTLASPFVFAQSLDPVQRQREQTLLDQQSRVEFARKGAAAAEDRVKRAENLVTEARNRKDRAERELRDASLVVDRTESDLEVARGQAIKAHESYSTESAKFQAMRRGE